MNNSGFILVDGPPFIIDISSKDYYENNSIFEIERFSTYKSIPEDKFEDLVDTITSEKSYMNHRSVKIPDIFQTISRHFFHIIDEDIFCRFCYLVDRCTNYQLNKAFFDIEKIISLPFIDKKYAEYVFERLDISYMNKTSVITNFNHLYITNGCPFEYEGKEYSEKIINFLSFLISKGADINAAIDGEESLIDIENNLITKCSKYFEDIDVVEFLLDNDADTQNCRSDGDDAITVSYMNENWKCFELYVNRGYCTLSEKEIFENIDNCKKPSDVKQGMKSKVREILESSGSRNIKG